MHRLASNLFVVNERTLVIYLTKHEAAHQRWATRVVAAPDGRLVRNLPDHTSTQLALAAFNVRDLNHLHRGVMDAPQTIGIDRSGHDGIGQNGAPSDQLREEEGLPRRRVEPSLNHREDLIGSGQDAVLDATIRADGELIEALGHGDPGSGTEASLNPLLLEAEVPPVAGVADHVEVAVATSDAEPGLPAVGVAHAETACDGSRLARVHLDIAEGRVLGAEQGSERCVERHVGHLQFGTELVPEVVRAISTEAFGNHGRFVVVRIIATPVECRIFGTHCFSPSCRSENTSIAKGFG